MGKFEAKCPSCGSKQEIEINGINELPKTVLCKCGNRYTKNKVPIK